MKNAILLKLFSLIYGKHPKNNILTWNWLFTRKNRQWIKQNIALFQDKIVADYGCGSCPYFAYLSKGVKKYIALDIMRDSSLSNDSKLVFSQLDSIGTIPNPIEKSDVIISNQVLMEVPNIDFYFGEMSKIVREGGHAFITGAWGMPAIGHNDRMRISPFYILQMLNKHGFKLIEYKTSGYFFSTMLLSLNLLLVTKNRYDILTSDVKISKFKWILFTPIILLNNILALFLDWIIPFKRCPANWLIIAKKQNGE